MDRCEHELRHVLDPVVEPARGHQLLLAPQQPVELVDHPLGHHRTPFEPRALDREPLVQELFVAEYLGDLVERQLE